MFFEKKIMRVDVGFEKILEVHHIGSGGLSMEITWVDSVVDGGGQSGVLDFK